MPRNIVLKFMIPTIAVVGIVMIVLATTVVHMMSTEVRDRARTQAASEADRAMDLLSTVDAMSADIVRASMQVLMREAQQLGAPTLDGTASIAGQSFPDLRLGATSQVGTFALVDLIKKLTGNTATLFVRHGDRFVRVSTNVLKPDGSRAVGTPLDPAGRAFAAIRANQAFYGVVDILGSPYMTGYEPMRNAAGTIIGIWYVGLPLASLADLGRHINGARILDNGYVALLQGKRVIFHSAHVGDDEIQRASEAGGRDGWTLITRPYEKWGYTLQVAYPESDIDGEISSTRTLVTMFAVVTALLVVVVLYLLIKRLIVRPVLAAVHTARQVAEGELRSQIQITANDEIGQLQNAMKDMAARLADTIGEVRAATNALSSASTEVAHTATDVAQGASTQATAVEQTHASLAEMSASIAENAENSRLSAEMVTRGAKDAEDSGNAVAETVTAMKTIAEKVQVIEEIARRTDLLALNAAVEAARAGDHGKGFAVVASEVRKLAERSQTAARGISGVARNSVAIATRSEQLIKALVATINRTAELVQSVAAASNEQTVGVQQINRAMAEVDQITQRNSLGAEKLAATAAQMSTQADVLQQLMAWFKLAGDRTADARALADVQRYRRPPARTERATLPRRPRATRSAAASVGVSRRRNRA